ncbi:cell wall metabolism sensor histidine kinase WalK [uncultured Microbacterium sp.]|uniref:sensor histidine kinase n=1 Tax=uncultured Microbacterium sp. TaxID=191216 RepID=UPI00263682DA|nr:HAMP domain-containing sensor histidine kinase [uncultured Microbacterium sp.]
MSTAPRTRGRRRWSLQTRLIVTVVSLVALILIAVGLATATTLRAIVADGLDSEIKAAASSIRIIPGTTAEDTLRAGRQQSGTMLIIDGLGGVSGAYVDADDAVVALDNAEIQEILARIPHVGFDTVDLPGLGENRVYSENVGDSFYVVIGMSAEEQVTTIAKVLTSVALITAGGLFALAAIIALVIRRSLKPLRSVADTAARVAAQPLDSGDVTITERVPASEADADDEIGRVGAALNTLLDHVDTSLTARQRNEERMRAFVADASHELRTPLAAIRGYSELSLRALSAAGGEGATPAQIEAGAQHSQHGLERINAASLRMTTLVEDLLLLARLDEGKELVYGAVDLARVAVDSVADAQAAGMDHEWIIDVPEEPVIVAGDAVRLHQVVANLLANARVHTPAGTRVSASVQVEDGMAVMRVADNGPGIDPAVADELFERFARADSSRARQTGGTGLGLSIAKAIATAHHGTLSVKSEPGATVFEVRLPARPGTPAS